jgi:hypothetical protein
MQKGRSMAVPFCIYAFANESVQDYDLLNSLLNIDLSSSFFASSE